MKVELTFCLEQIYLTANLYQPEDQCFQVGARMILIVWQEKQKFGHNAISNSTIHMLCVLRNAHAIISQ